MISYSASKDIVSRTQRVVGGKWKDFGVFSLIPTKIMALGIFHSRKNYHQHVHILEAEVHNMEKQGE